MKTVKLALSLVIASLATSAVIAQEDGLVMEMKDFTCRDLLIRSGFERDFTVAFMHGYMSGKMGELTFDAPALTAATDAVLGACIDNPDQPLMMAFEAARG